MRTRSNRPIGPIVHRPAYGRQAECRPDRCSRTGRRSPRKCPRCRCSSAARSFAADGAQFLADPGVDGRGRQGIGAGPTQIVILQADGGKESAGLHRPGNAIGIRRGVPGEIGFKASTTSRSCGSARATAIRCRLSPRSRSPLRHRLGEPKSRVAAIAEFGKPAIQPTGLLYKCRQAEIGVGVPRKIERPSPLARRQKQGQKQAGSGQPSPHGDYVRWAYLIWGNRDFSR